MLTDAAVANAVVRFIGSPAQSSGIEVLGDEEDGDEVVEPCRWPSPCLRVSVGEPEGSVVGLGWVAAVVGLEVAGRRGGVVRVEREAGGAELSSSGCSAVGCSGSVDSGGGSVACASVGAGVAGTTTGVAGDSWVDVPPAVPAELLDGATDVDVEVDVVEVDVVAFSNRSEPTLVAGPRSPRASSRPFA